MKGSCAHTSTFKATVKKNKGESSGDSEAGEKANTRLRCKTRDGCKAILQSQ
jgi:hypothetical protein